MGTQNLNFIAYIQKQIGDHNNAFPWDVRGHNIILKAARMKVGWTRPNQRFSKNRGKNCPIFQLATFIVAFWRLHRNAMSVVVWIVRVLQISDRRLDHCRMFESFENRNYSNLSIRSRPLTIWGCGAYFLRTSFFLGGGETGVLSGGGGGGVCEKWPQFYIG